MKRVAHGRDGDLNLRRELFGKIRKELLSHAVAEEQVFYSTLRSYDRTRALVGQSGSDHEEVKQMLERLASMDISDSSWLPAFEVMMHSVEAHVEREEHELFPLAKDVLSKDQISDLESSFVSAKETCLKSIG